MKTFKFPVLGLNPIYRDIVLVLLAGLFASISLVTVGYMVFSQY